MSREGMVLTPEAQAENESFRRDYGREGNCSCHLSPPCGSCTHPGNPLNLDEDDAAWVSDVKQDPDAAWARLGDDIEKYQISLSSPGSPVHRNGGNSPGWGKSGYWTATAFNSGLPKRPIAHGHSSALEALDALVKKIKEGGEV